MVRGSLGVDEGCWKRIGADPDLGDTPCTWMRGLFLQVSCSKDFVLSKSDTNVVVVSLRSPFTKWLKAGSLLKSFFDDEDPFDVVLSKEVEPEKKPFSLTESGIHFTKCDKIPS